MTRPRADRFGLGRWLAAAALALLLAGGSSAEARNRCARDGGVTECTSAKTVRPGDRQQVKQIGAFSIFVEYSFAEDCAPGEPGCQQVDLCQSHVEVDEDGNGEPEWTDYVVSYGLPGFAHGFGTSFSLTTRRGEILLIEQSAAEFREGVSC